MKDGDIEAKIDDLACMVAEGFTEVREEFKAIRAEMATQDDLAELRAEMVTRSDLARLTGDINIMLDKHIGIFCKDFDELAARVKRLDDIKLRRATAKTLRSKERGISPFTESSVTGRHRYHTYPGR